MTVHVSAKAEADLDGLVDFIARDSPRSSIAVLDRILESLTRLSNFPRLGRSGAMAETFELVVHRTPYILVYRLDGNDVEVLRVRHGAQEWPPQD